MSAATITEPDVYPPDLSNAEPAELSEFQFDVRPILERISNLATLEELRLAKEPIGLCGEPTLRVIDDIVLAAADSRWPVPETVRPIMASIALLVREKRVFEKRRGLAEVGGVTDVNKLAPHDGFLRSVDSVIAAAREYPKSPDPAPQIESVSTLVRQGVGFRQISRMTGITEVEAMQAVADPEFAKKLDGNFVSQPDRDRKKRRDREDQEISSLIRFEGAAIVRARAVLAGGS